MDSRLPVRHLRVVLVDNPRQVKGADEIKPAEQWPITAELLHAVPPYREISDTLLRTTLAADTSAADR